MCLPMKWNYLSCQFSPFLTAVLVMDSFFISVIEITGSPVVQEAQSGR